MSNKWQDIIKKLPFLSLALLTFFVCMSRYADYDLWWHLRLGETIATSRFLPWLDSFSYTAAGRHQFTGEWLADLIIFSTFHTAGFLGLNLLKAVLLFITAIFLYLQIKSNSCSKRTALVAVITLLLVLFSLRFRLFVRPYLFSLPFMAIFLFFLGRWRSGIQDWRIYIMPLLMLVWANISVGAVFGLFLVGMAAMLDIYECKSLRLVPALLLTIAASLINPESWHLYTLAIDLTSDPYRTLIGEYQPVSIDMLFGSGLRYTLCFQILALGGSIHLLLNRGWKDLFQLIIFSFFLFESFRQIRLVELFSIAAAPSFALFLARVLSSLPDFSTRGSSFARIVFSLAILALIPIAVISSKVYTFGIGPKEGAFPENALSFLDEKKISGKMFNSYSFGGYAIWRAKERRVFIDGRYRRLYTPYEYGEYKGIIDSAESWKTAEKKYGFDYALIDYDMMSRRFPSHLLTNSDWALVYWDNFSLIYLKRTPDRRELIEQLEYRIARPTFLDLSYLDNYTSTGKIHEALAALNREVALNTNNQFVVLAKVYLQFQLGKLYLPQIKSDLENVMSMKPDFAMKHSALAMVLAATGEKDHAKVEVLNALRLDSFDAGAIALAKDMGIKVNLPKGGIPGHP